MIFTFSLCCLALNLIPLLTRLIDQRRQFAATRVELFKLTPVCAQALFKRGKLLAGVGHQHAPRERAGDLAVRHPEFRAAIAVHNDAAARDDATPRRDHLRHVLQPFGQKHRAEQPGRSRCECIGDLYLIQQADQSGRRCGTRVAAAIHRDDARCGMLALCKKCGQRLPCAGGITHNHRIQPGAQRRLKCQTQVGGRGQLVGQCPEHRMRREPQRILRIQHLLRTGGKFIG